MDPSKPPDLGDVTGVHWLGRGRGLQPEELTIGRSRGLLLTTEGSGIGRARGFPIPGDHFQRQVVSLPPAESVVPQCRGLLVQPGDVGVSRASRLLFPATEPKLGVSRGAVLPEMIEQHERKPSFKMTSPVSEGDVSTLPEEKVGTRNIFKFIDNLLFYYFALYKYPCDLISFAG